MHNLTYMLFLYLFRFYYSTICLTFYATFMQHLCNFYATFSFIFFIIGIVNHFALFYVFVIFNHAKDQKTAPICPIYTVSLHFCNKPYV
jgi:hypothetical protein